MDFFKTSVSIFTASLLKKKTYFFTLLALPVILIFLGILSSKGLDNNLKVGIFLTENNPIENKIAAELCQATDNDITFCIEASEKELTRKVANGKYLCGYIFNANFSQGIASLNTKDLITEISLPQSPYPIIVNEIVATQVYRRLSYYIAQDFLQSTPETKNIYTLDEITQKIESYLSSESMLFIDTKIEGIDAEQLAVKSLVSASLVRGVIAIYLLFLSLLGCIYTASTVKNGNLQTLSVYKNKYLLQLYYLIPQFLLPLCVCMVSIICFKIAMPDYFASIFAELVMLVVYQLVLTQISFCISNIISSDIILSAIPFILIGGFVLSPVLFDITTVFPLLKPILQLTPTYQYVIFNTQPSIILYSLLTVLISFSFIGIIVCKKKHFKV